MEYFKGIDLWTFLLDKNSHIREQDVRKILKQLPGALHFMHNMDIVHGDIHMGNVMVNESKYIKLNNFGGAITGAEATLSKRRDKMKLMNIEEMLLYTAQDREHAKERFLKIWRT